MQAHIALGSNLGDRYENFRRAIRLIGEVTTVTAVSRTHDTAPLVLPGKNSGDVPAYLNAVITVETSLSPAELLDTLLKIEKILGRDRNLETERWMSRMLDLDILAIQDLVISTGTLTVPHPELHRRDFVLVPFSEIAADWRHPVQKTSVSEMLNAVREGNPSK